MIPDSAVSVEPKKIFHLHLLLYVLLPTVLYGVALYIIVDHFQLGLIPQTALAIFTAVVGVGIMWYRYQKCVFAVEIIQHAIFCTVLYPFVVLVNTIMCEIVGMLFGPDGVHLIGLGILVPIDEEFWKWLAVRYVAFSSSVLDPNALFCYGCISGFLFAVWENLLFGTQGPPQGVIRVFGIICHTGFVVISAGRFAEWRFLGKHGGFWMIIWPSAALHIAHNFLSCWINMVMVIVSPIASIVLARVYIQRMSSLPTVDIHEVAQTGQVLDSMGQAVVLLLQCTWCMVQ